MKKEIIIAGSLGLVAGLIIMHFAMKKGESKSNANGDFVTDKSKKVWDNMLDVTGTPIGPEGGQVKGRVSNMLDADASEVSNMLDVEGYSNLYYPKSGRASNMLDANGQSKRYFPRANARVEAIVNNARGNRSWPNPKTGSGWS